ncbi:hypothetical protein F4818DRAFT_420749 [Hypoxylon cercidicola]|nr:hypothetical protein F4818DRAFT_420749 [Hypoxylon cercidicola]
MTRNRLGKRRDVSSGALTTHRRARWIIRLDVWLEGVAAAMMVLLMITLRRVQILIFFFSFSLTFFSFFNYKYKRHWIKENNRLVFSVVKRQ